MTILSVFRFKFKTTKLFLDSVFVYKSCQSELCKRTYATAKTTHFDFTKNLNYKITFFGSDKFALPSLIALTRYSASPDLITVVVSNLTNTIGKFAIENSLQTISWDEYKSRVNEKEVFSNQLGVVASFGYLIPSKIIDTFPLGILNVHASLLPRWRGASPISHALINGDTETGISIMKIAPYKFDIGSIYHQKKISIHPDIREPELHHLLSILGAETLIEVVSDLDSFKTIKQDETKATLAPKLSADELSTIKWKSQNAKQIYNLFRGVTGSFKLQSTFNGGQVDLDEMAIMRHPPEELDTKMLSVPPFDELEKPPSKKFNFDTDFTEFYPGTRLAKFFNSWMNLPSSSAPGTVLYRNNLLCVKCGGEYHDDDKNWVYISRVKVNAKWQSAVDFQNGYLSKINDSKARVFSEEPATKVYKIKSTRKVRKIGVV